MIILLFALGMSAALAVVALIATEKAHNSMGVGRRLAHKNTGFASL